jgi:hypothetical protein
LPFSTATNANDEPPKFEPPKIKRASRLSRVRGRPGSPPPELLVIKVTPLAFHGNGTDVPELTHQGAIPARTPLDAAKNWIRRRPARLHEQMGRSPPGFALWPWRDKEPYPWDPLEDAVGRLAGAVSLALGGSRRSLRDPQLRSPEVPRGLGSLPWEWWDGSAGEADDPTEVEDGEPVVEWAPVWRPM